MVAELKQELEETKESLDEAVSYIDDQNAQMRGFMEAMGSYQKSYEEKFEELGRIIGAAIVTNGGELRLGKDLMDTMSGQQFAIRHEMQEDELVLVVKKPDEPEQPFVMDDEEGE